MTSPDWPTDLGDLSLPKGATSHRVDTVARTLGLVLKSGYLTLFVGAGVSKVVSLPMWQELNKRIVEEAPALLASKFNGLWNDKLKSRLPTPAEMDVQDADCLGLLDRVEEVCSLCETLAETGAGDPNKYKGDAPSWHELVKRALYRGKDSYAFTEMFHPELVSLCSLMTGVRRGSVREVISFNYDDLIQHYLRLHGHSYHVVTPLPNSLTPNHYTVFYHPHGYLPLQDRAFRPSPSIVLSQRSYGDVVSRDHARSWRRQIAWMLSVRIGLLVGISGTDRILETYFDDALALADPTGGRPLAFVILVGDEYLPPEKWLEKRIVPLEFPDATTIAQFLALVCERAA